ncbi:MAG TPA: serine kinase [Xanthobacteraceae bacterium]|jgi:serine kinase of HPr protein (carbohydrate metabolism regulator)|nr:serine kinase [Xanthobacteraceae bacterium]
MGNDNPTAHGSVVLVGARGIFIRGAAGAGKSRLVLALLEAAAAGRIPFARLVADDRVHLTATNGTLLARPPQALAGRMEIRGIGIVSVEFESVAKVDLVVDLADQNAARLPEPADCTVTIAGVPLPRVSAAPGTDPLPLVLVALRAP